MCNIEGHLTNYGLCISKKDLIKLEDNVQISKKIRDYFTAIPELDIEDDEEIEPYELYYEDENYIALPKFASEKKIEYITKDIRKTFITFSVKKYKYNHTPIKIAFKGSLREYQEKIINDSIKLFASKEKGPKGGILQLGCGAGKTVMAINLACKLNLKTLIVVHKEFLQDQWIDRIKSFTDAKVGIIRQKKCEINNDIVVGMVHSISSIDYPENTFKDFGLVIYDEVHHMGSRVFSRCLLKTSAEYTLGLSATPQRQDGMMKVVNWCVGDVIYKMKRNFDYKVFVKRINFKSVDIKFKEKKRWIKGSIRPDHSKMTENLITIESRTKLIINIVDTLRCSGEGRKILILSSRIEHLEKIKAGVDKYIKDAEEEHIYNTYYYMGSTKKGERRLAEKDGDIIFATLQLAEEGLDIDKLNAIILAVPLKMEKTIEQAIGRIMRKDTIEDLSQIPLVIDVVDTLSIYQKWGEKRNNIYNRNGWFIQDFYFEDNNYIARPIDTPNKNFINIMFDDLEDENFIENNLIKKKDCVNNTEECIQEKKIDSKKKDKNNYVNPKQNIINNFVFGAKK